VGNAGRLQLIATGFVAVAVACGDAPRPAALPATSARNWTAPATSTPPSVPTSTQVEPTSGPPSALEADAPSPRGDAGPGRIGCGPASCVVEEGEYCCFASPAGREGADPHHKCLTSRTGSVHPKLSRHGAAPIADAETCRVGGMHYCDGASDCPAHHLCCAWNAPRATCVPLGPGRGSTCGGGEVCAGGDACRTPGAVCERGRCRKAGREVRCGSLACRDDASTCCFDKYGEPFCAVGACPARSGAEMRCTAHDDCLPSERCCAYRHGAECSAFCDSGDTPLCRSDADCRGAVIRDEDDRSGVAAPACHPIGLAELARCEPTTWRVP